MKLRITAVVLLALVGGFTAAVPSGTAQEKQDKDGTDAALVKALKDADVLFTGKIGKVSPLAQTNSIPPSTFGKVTFKDTKILRGVLPDGATFTYSYKEGTTKNLDLRTDGQVLVAVKQKGVAVVVPATEANLALARQVIEAAKQK